MNMSTAVQGPHSPPLNSVVSLTHRPSPVSSHQSAPAHHPHPIPFIFSPGCEPHVAGDISHISTYDIVRPSWRRLTLLHFWTSAILASFMACLRLHSLVSSWQTAGTLKNIKQSKVVSSMDRKSIWLEIAPQNRDRPKSVLMDRKWHKNLKPEQPSPSG